MHSLSKTETWLYDNLPVGVAILDPSLVYRYTNPSYSATQGYTPVQLRDQPLSKGQPDWIELITRLSEEAKEAGHAVELFNVPLIYPRQPSLQRIWDVTVLPVFTDKNLESFVIYLLDVTSRRQAEQLNRSEYRLRTILSVAVDAILVIDEDGIILQANPATSRIFGYATDELVGQPIRTIMPQNTSLEHDRFMDRYLNTGIPHIIGTVREVEGRRKDGKIISCELSVSESREEGDRRIFVGILRDITERKQTETALERLYRQNDLILKAAGEGICGLDVEGTIVFANPAAATLTGYDVMELIGKKSHETLHYAYRDGTPYPEERCPIVAAYTDGKTHLVTDEVFWRKDGSSFDVQYLSTPIRENDVLIGAVITFNDISERKHLIQELADARARLEAILDTVPLPLFVVDANGEITIANDAARAFYGKILETGEIFHSLRLHPDNRQAWPAEDWPIVRSLREGAIYHNIEQLVVFPDGREVPMLVHAAPVIVDNKVIASVGVAQDLTRLKEADRAKDAFLALISHELRSPLTIIISWADLIIEDPSLCAEGIEVIMRSAQTQKRIIDDLLDLSRAIYGKLTLVTEPVDLWDIISNALAGMSAGIESKGLTLEVTSPGAPLPVDVDTVRIGQVVTNLLTNAMKFTPEGGTITVTANREDKMAHFSVSDNGSGIPPDLLPLIFHRFQQLGRERISGGLGLGLAIVKSLVELHGGRVEASSAGLNKGSTFNVWLPLRET